MKLIKSKPREKSGRGEGWKKKRAEALIGLEDAPEVRKSLLTLQLPFYPGEKGPGDEGGPWSSAFSFVTFVIRIEENKIHR